jgi:hypothetical protein
MRTFAELGHVHRCEPCIEYPGEWLVFIQGAVSSHATFDNAMKVALGGVSGYDTLPQDEPLRVSICWKCSDNDPRVGQVWFTGFYQHGKFNQFGAYKS